MADNNEKQKYHEEKLEGTEEKEKENEEEEHKGEFYLNSPSGRHYLDIDLPPHWFRYFTEEKEEYFFNEITGETTWSKPEGTVITRHEVIKEQHTSDTSHDENHHLTSTTDHIETDEHTEAHHTIDEVTESTEDLNLTQELPEDHQKEGNGEYHHPNHHSNENDEDENHVDEEEEENRHQKAEEESLEKARFITQIHNNRPNYTPQEAPVEPVALAVEVPVAIEIQHELAPSHIDFIAGNSSPLTHEHPPLYTASRAIMSEERVRNWDRNTPASGSTNPFDDCVDDVPLIPNGNAQNPFDVAHASTAQKLSAPSNWAVSSHRGNTASKSKSPAAAAAAAVAATPNMAAYTYAPPPPLTQGTKKASHNPFTEDSSVSRFHQPHHEQPPPVHQPQRSTPLVFGTVQDKTFAVEPPSTRPAAPPAPAKSHSSLLAALKAEKAQQQQQNQGNNPFGNAPVTQVANNSPPPPKAEKKRAAPLLPPGAAHIPEQVAFSNPTHGLTPQLIKLLQFGVRQIPAMNALSTSQNNPRHALKAIYQQIRTSLIADVNSSQLNIFKTRLTTRIKSWLPNYLDSQQADFHTKYVCTIAYDTIGGTIISWQVNFRYSNIKELYQVVTKYSSEINAICPLIETFPLSTVSQGIFGIDDTVRNKRMNQFDLWLREVIMNPLAMTTWEIAEAAYQFLEFYAHVHDT